LAANANGLSADAAAARSDCQVPAKREIAYAHMEKHTIPVNVNLVWNALEDGGYVQVFGRDLAVLFMNLTGSLIILEQNGQQSLVALRGRANDDDYLELFLQGGQTELDHCRDVNCLQLEKKVVHINTANAFQPMVFTMLLSLQNKIKQSNQLLTTAETNLITISRFPLIKIIQLAIIDGGFPVNLSLLAEIVALDMLRKFVGDVLITIHDNLLKSWTTSGIAPLVQQLRSDLEILERRVTAKFSNNHQNLEYAIKIMEVSRSFEKELANKWHHHINSLVNFSGQ
jgi:hypothetical protein